ncbi:MULTISPECIES: hypothetical protein [Hyphomicrobiales]|jgi:predicted YcjX-like family ATPase|uniref:Uncharacterized protein n=2 Tax=Prosthecodimorpha TaxID=2981530 RepID=A0A0N8GEN7_9HYPH|nr:MULTISPECIES: hypothetical protein [Hyphomicrobiales]KPL52033.1 hypothetical protein ABB55_07160 [Prosthecomicrobium hirschii]MBT9288630.1 hypothetical protein [Prosthecodimorpha staleyi]MCW1843599.1 hypothetical protein [Prosthecomicrobium hirschii]TPQ46977.1 hypothetical protein C2U72_25080 [Prosthecomicrobium hirschii]
MLDERKADEVETTVADKKRAAYEIVADAMAEAEAEGIEYEIVTQAALFAVLTELVGHYGEAAVAALAGRLSDRIMAGEYTLVRPLQ